MPLLYVRLSNHRSQFKVPVCSGQVILKIDSKASDLFVQLSGHAQSATFHV